MSTNRFANGRLCPARRGDGHPHLCQFYASKEAIPR